MTTWKLTDEHVNAVWERIKDPFYYGLRPCLSQSCLAGLVGEENDADELHVVQSNRVKSASKRFNKSIAGMGATSASALYRKRAA